MKKKKKKQGQLKTLECGYHSTNNSDYTINCSLFKSRNTSLLAIDCTEQKNDRHYKIF